MTKASKPTTRKKKSTAKKVGKKTTKKKGKATVKKLGRTAGTPKYPRHSLDKALRVSRAILDQNAGKECTEKGAADFVGVGLNGPFRVEISSGIKFGLLERPSTGRVAITDLAKTILRPQRPQEELEGLRQAVFKAPDISDVYSHYRGENLPDKQFFDNALVEDRKSVV